jgi:hypothetical protein
MKRRLPGSSAAGLSESAPAGASLAGRMFHVGVIVEDLERGMAEWGDALGVRWRTPFSAVAQVHRAGTVADVQVAAVYSVAGPVHIELIPLSPGTVWDVLGVHHIGYWSDDLDGDIERQVATGTSVEALMRRDGRTLAAYLHLGSARVELLPTTSRQRLVGAPDRSGPGDPEVLAEPVAGGLRGRRELRAGVGVEMPAADQRTSDACESTALGSPELSRPSTDVWSAFS